MSIKEEKIWKLCYWKKLPHNLFFYISFIGFFACICLVGNILTIEIFSSNECAHNWHLTRSILSFKILSTIPIPRTPTQTQTTWKTLKYCVSLFCLLLFRLILGCFNGEKMLVSTENLYVQTSFSLDITAVDIHGQKTGFVF